MSFFGDGATNIGAFHEAVNMAAVWDLPVIFICENNGYAEFTSQDRHMKLTDIAERAISYGIPGVIVDGMDALAVRAVMLEAVERGFLRADNIGMVGGWVCHEHAPSPSAIDTYYATFHHNTT